jgi:hypothetical protein
MRIAVIAVLVVLLTGCGTSGTTAIKGVNTVERISSITEAGVREELANCARDWFDPANRGSGCN